MIKEKIMQSYTLYLQQLKVLICDYFPATTGTMEFRFEGFQLDKPLASLSAYG